MGARRVLAVAASMLLVLTACSDGSDDTAEPPAEGRSTDALADELADALTTAGVTVVDALVTDTPLAGLELWTDQLSALEAELEAGGGWFGWELDGLTGDVGGVPFSYVVAGWLSAAPTEVASAAAEIMGDQDWTQAPSIVFPTAILTLFVADAVQVAAPDLPPQSMPADPSRDADARATGVVTAAAGQVVPLAGAGEDETVCGILSEWISRIMDYIFGSLKVEVDGTGIGVWLASIWNEVVELARDLVETTAETVLDVLTGPLQGALAIIATLATVAPLLQRWELDLTASSLQTRLAVGDEPDIVETFTVAVDTGVDFTWDDHPEIAACARLAGLDLPDPSRAAPATVSWKLVNAPLTASVISKETEIQADNTATVRWRTGREESDEGQPFPGVAQARATVVSDQPEKYADMVESWLLGKLPGGFVGEKLSELFSSLTEEILGAIIEKVQVRSDPVTVDVFSHVDVEFDYPQDVPEGDGEGPGDADGPGDVLAATGFSLIQQIYSFRAQTAQDGEEILSRYEIVSYDGDPSKQSVESVNGGPPLPHEPLGFDGYGASYGSSMTSAFAEAGLDVHVEAADDIAILGEFFRELSGSPTGSLGVNTTGIASAGIVFSTSSAVDVTMAWSCKLGVSLAPLEDPRNGLVQTRYYDEQYPPHPITPDERFNSTCDDVDTVYSGTIAPDTAYQLVVEIGMADDRYGNEGKVYGNSGRVLDETKDSFLLTEEFRFEMRLSPPG